MRPSARSRGMPRVRPSRRSTPIWLASESPSVANDEQRLIEEIQAELAKLKVSDLLLQTLYSVSSLAYHRLGADGRDLAQARLAIEALKALVPVLEGSVPEEALRDFAQVLANLQLAYASAASEEAGA